MSTKVQAVTRAAERMVTAPPIKPMFRNANGKAKLPVPDPIHIHDHTIDTIRSTLVT